MGEDSFAGGEQRGAYITLSSETRDNFALKFSLGRSVPFEG